MLENRQSLFVAEYVRHRNGARAAVAAGYSPRAAKEQASRLLTKDHVRVAVGEKCQETAAKLQIEFDQVKLGLLESYRQAKALGRPSDMISAMREVAKLLGFYDRRAQKEVISANSQELLRRLETMPDQELVRLIEAEKAS